MTALCIILGIVAFILFLLFVPIRLKISYDQDIKLKLSVLFVSFLLFPRPKKVRLRHYSKKSMLKRQKKAEKKAKKEAAKRKKTPPPPPTPKKKKTIKDHLRMVKLIVLILKKVQKRARGTFKLRISHFYALLATGDAASTALLYGGVSQSCAYILALSKGFIKTSYKAKNICIIPDYCGNETKFFIRLSLRTDIFHLLMLAFSALTAYISSQKTLKNGGTKNG